MFYFNELSIIKTLNINSVLQPHCLTISPCLLPTLQRCVLQSMEFVMLWTMCLENTLENMIETCLSKLKLVLRTFETWYKHRNWPKIVIKYMVDLMLLWKHYIMSNLFFLFKHWILIVFFTHHVLEQGIAQFQYY